MKVSELIVYLKFMPQDAQVKYLCRTDHGCFEGKLIHVWQTDEGDVLVSDQVEVIKESNITFTTS